MSYEVVETRDQWPAPMFAEYTRIDKGSPEDWHFFAWDHSDYYERIVSEMAAHVFPEETDYYYQREPNLRIHPPGCEGTAPHTDAECGHLDAEWNVWVPLTEPTEDCHRLWVEQQGFMWPVEVELGQALIFPGASTKHGTVANTSEIESRSFDFRLIAKDAYEDRGLKTVKYGVPLRAPEYWAG